MGETKPTAWSGVFNGVRAMAASFSEENSLPGAARRGPGDVAQEQFSGVSEDATIELREKLALARYHSFVAAKVRLSLPFEISGGWVSVPFLLVDLFGLFGYMTSILKSS